MSFPTTPVLDAFTRANESPLAGSWGGAIQASDGRLELISNQARSAFTPLDLPGLALWLKADAITGLNDGDPVATWVDSSGVGNDLTQGTPSLRPLWKAAVRNGLPVVRCDNTDDVLLRSTLVGGDLAQPDFMALAFGLTTVADANALIDGGQGRQLVDSQIGPAQWRMFAGASYVGGTPTAAWHTLSCQWNGASSILRIDGVALAAGNAGTNFLRGVRVGLSAGNSEPLDGDLGEVVVCSAIPDAATIANTEAYLKARWATV
jgi:hypothetical protein